MNADDAAAREAQVNEAIADYLDAVASGATPDPEQFIARHLEIARELRAFFADRARFVQFASPIEKKAAGPQASGGAGPAPTLGLGEGGPPAPLGRIRYFGDYELLEEVARGGMGVVYKARQTSLKRTVALKMILAGQLAGDDDVKRFHAEAEAAARLEHPNIVPIFEIGQAEGQHYFSMAFVEGESLAHRIARGLLPSREAARLMQTVARAIAFAHVEGVIHRDLTPANVLVDKAGEPHITDFGLAKRLAPAPNWPQRGEAESVHQLTATGQILGTPGYMPPEQASGRANEIGPAADVYASGAVLYCALTGRPPFQAASLLDTLSQVIDRDPVSPRLLNPAVPRDLETICLKCLEKEPSRRYAGAAELADDLERFLNDDPIVARPVGPAERLGRWARKHRQALIRTVATAALSLLAALGAGYGWNWYQDSLCGTLVLGTSGEHVTWTSEPQMVANVLDEHDRPVVPWVPVPTPEPIKLPAGPYRVQLSASGLISDTWPFEVERGRLQYFDVQFRSRLMWPPREVPTDEVPETNAPAETEIVDLDGHASVLQILYRRYEPNDGSPTVRSLRLIDGRTGKSAWPSDVMLDEANVPNGRNKHEWTSLLGVSRVLELWTRLGVSGVVDLSNDRRLVRPLVDLDGDGVRDLVFVARTSPSLVAFSGRDGGLLWWHRSGPLLPADVDAASLVPWPDDVIVGRGSVVGQAAVADVNSDGTPDVIACFMTAGEAFLRADGQQVSAPPQGWIAAVSGRDGAALWQERLDTTFEKFPGSSEPERHYNALTRPLVVQGGARGQVAVVIDLTVSLFELATGQPRAKRFELPAMPFAAPVAADLNRDGEDDLLLLSMGERPQRSNAPLVTLTAVTQSGRISWSKAFQPADRDELRESAQPLFLVEDLDQDGRPEVVLGNANYPTFSSDDRWSQLELLDGETGEAKWQQRLAFEPGSEAPAVRRVVIGPDLDGDGFRELFAAYGQSVAAFSGRDGKRFWQRQHGGPQGSTPQAIWGDLRSWQRQQEGPEGGPLAWWQPGEDGWPLLVVPVYSRPGGQHITYFLEAGSGRPAHTLPEAFALHVADFNGDGIADVFYTVSPQGAPRMLVAQGAQTEPWSRLGKWNPIQDVDGDGVADMLQRNGTQVRSGRTNQPLHNLEFPLDVSYRHAALAPPLPFGDLDGDGTPDLVGLHRAQRRVDPVTSWYTTLAAFSGRDGRRLWVARDYEFGHGENPMFDWCDLDNDGRAEIAAVSARSSSDSTMLLSMLSGDDGRLLWQVRLVMGAFGAHPDPYGRQYEDLNGDGMRDLVLWTPLPRATANNRPWELQAFSGRDGTPLWTESYVRLDQGGTPRWPRPAVGDLDGDGHPEVVAARHTGKDRSDGQILDLVAVDGSTGEVQWRHEFQGNTFLERIYDSLPPLLVDFEGNGQRAVCFGISRRDGLYVTVLDPAGRPRPGSPFKLSDKPIDVLASLCHKHLAPLWNKLDLEGDGREALLLCADDKLCASRGTADFVWQWPLPQSQQREYSTNPDVFLDLQPAADNRPATIVVWSGQAVYALDASTAAIRWRCDVPWSPGQGASIPPVVRLLASKDKSGAPPVLCRWGSLDDWWTVVRQAWPTTPDGRFVPPVPAPRSYVPLPDVPPDRFLPWVASGEYGGGVWAAIVLNGQVTAIMIVIPAWLGRVLLRRRSWWIALLLAAYAAILLKPALFPYAPNAQAAQAVPSLLALVVSACLVRAAVRERSRRVAILALGLFLLIVAPLAIFNHWAATQGMAQLYFWNGWWWLRLLVMALVAAPCVAFWWPLARAIARRDWATAGRLLIAATLLAVLLAAAMLAIDNRRLGPDQQYSLAGSYLIWLGGAYLAGPALLARRALQWSWRRLRPSGSPHQPM